MKVTITQNPSLARLIAFEQATWPLEEQASVELLKARSEQFGEGIFLLSDENGTDVAQFSSAPKRYKAEDIRTYDQMAEMPIEESEALWGLNLAVHPDHQGKGYAAQVVEPAFQWAAQAGYKSWAGGVTCHRLAQLVEEGVVIDALDYMRQGRNPALRTFKTVCASNNWGFKALDPTPGYWEIDLASLGYGVIIQIAF